MEKTTDGLELNNIEDFFDVDFDNTDTTETVEIGEDNEETSFTISDDEEEQTATGDNSSEEEEQEPEETSASDDDKAQPEEDKTEPDSEQKASHYSLVVQDLLESGEWQDAEIEQEDGTTVKLSELKDLDKETFITIKNSQAGFEKEDLKENYISLKDKDETTKKLMSIVANGGDLKEIFKTPAALKKPFEDVDVEDEGVQSNILYQQYLRQGIEPDDAKELVEKAKKDLTLDSKTTKIVEHYQTAWKEHIDKTAKQVEESRREEEKKVKEFKKSLLDIYKERNFKDTVAKKYADYGLKRNEDGEFEIDSIYAKKMEDPQEAADLIQFIVDKDSFLEQYNSKANTKAEVKNLKKITLINKKDRKAVEQEKQEDEEIQFT